MTEKHVVRSRKAFKLKDGTRLKRGENALTEEQYAAMRADPSVKMGHVMDVAQADPKEKVAARAAMPAQRGGPAAGPASARPGIPQEVEPGKPVGGKGHDIVSGHGAKDDEHHKRSRDK